MIGSDIGYARRLGEVVDLEKTTKKFLDSAISTFTACLSANLEALSFSTPFNPELTEECIKYMNLGKKGFTPELLIKLINDSRVSWASDGMYDDVLCPDECQTQSCLIIRVANDLLRLISFKTLLDCKI